MQGGPPGVDETFAEAFRHHQAGRLGDAERLYRQILAAEPGHADSLHLLGVIAWQAGHPDAAAELIGRAVAVNPGIAAYHCNLGNALKDLGRLGEAVDSYRTAVGLKPDYAKAYVNLGAALLAQGRQAEAAECCRRAVGLDPGLAEARNTLGNALLALGQVDEAAGAYRESVALRPDYPQAHYNLGIVLQRQGRLAEAVDSYRRAIALKPDYPEALLNLGNALNDLGRLDEAVACYRGAVAQAPGYADAYANLAMALTQCGRRDEAEPAFAAAIRLGPRTGSHYWALAESRRFAAGDPLIAAMRDLAADPDLPEDDRLPLHFALGKALDEAGDPAGAFEHLLRGNALKRARIAYDEAATLARLERITSVFSAELLRARAGAGDPSPRPVFVVGMPRSGSTLIEQILASHPQVFAAGESEALDRAAAGLAAPFPESAADLAGGRWRAVGAAYLAEIGGRAGGSARVVDKTPANFAMVGLIHLALPNARIVHSVRDPVDTCLSCFSKLFANGQPFTYDLAELGRYWRACDRLMRHWQAVLPPGVLMELRYEDLVSDPEGQARRLLDHCRLDWDPACLEFHRSQRVVRTASAAQVRRPLYASAVGRWQAYGRDRLRPLLDALGMAP